MKKFRRISQDLVHQNPYWRAYRDRYLQANGEEGSYHYMATAGSVMVIPRLSDERYILIRQYRYIQQAWGLEFPGGGQVEGLSSQQAAARELREETGFHAASWTSLGRFSPCVGLLDEFCDVYLAEDLSPGLPQPEEAELIEVVHMDLREIQEAITTGALWSGMSLAAWAQLHLAKGS